MTVVLKLLFDECLGHPLVPTLATFLEKAGYPCECKHIRDFQYNGVADDKWVPLIADQGWIVISADSGKKKSVGEKLPKVCRAYGVSHVILSPKLHYRKQHFKFLKIMEVAYQLQKVADAPGGSRFSLRLSTDDRAVLVERPHIIPSDEQSIRKVQQPLPLPPQPPLGEVK